MLLVTGIGSLAGFTGTLQSEKSIVAPVRQILILGSWVRAPEPPYGNSQLLISKP